MSNKVINRQSWLVPEGKGWEVNHPHNNNINKYDSHPPSESKDWNRRRDMYT